MCYNTSILLLWSIKIAILCETVSCAKDELRSPNPIIKKKEEFSVYL